MLAFLLKLTGERLCGVHFTQEDRDLEAIATSVVTSTAPFQDPLMKSSLSPTLQTPIGARVDCDTKRPVSGCGVQSETCASLRRMFVNGVAFKRLSVTDIDTDIEGFPYLQHVSEDPMGIQLALATCARALVHANLGWMDRLCSTVAIFLIVYALKCEDELHRQNRAIVTLWYDAVHRDASSRLSTLAECGPRRLIEMTHERMRRLLIEQPMLRLVDNNVGVRCEWRIEALRKHRLMSNTHALLATGSIHFFHCMAVEHPSEDVLATVRAAARESDSETVEAFLLCIWTTLFRTPAQRGVRMHLTRALGVRGPHVVDAALVLARNALERMTKEWEWDAHGQVHPMSETKTRARLGATVRALQAMRDIFE